MSQKKDPLQRHLVVNRLHEKEEEQLQERIIEFRKLLNESQSLDEFDPQIFNCLVKSIIVGGYDEEGNEDPYKLIFVYRSNFESVYTGYKGRKRKKESQRMRMMKQWMTMQICVQPTMTRKKNLHQTNLTTHVEVVSMLAKTK